MKKITVLGLTSNYKLAIVYDDGQSFIQTKFEGFQIINDIKFRPLFDELINQEIQCSFNKNQKAIRYQNQLFFTKLLQAGALIINSKQLDDSKLYTSEQKQNFSKITKLSKSEKNLKTGIILNEKENSTILTNLINQNKSFKAKIQCMSDNLLIRFVHQSQIMFLKCKIQNCKQYFQIFPQITFWKNNFLPSDIQVKLISEKYNFLNRSTQIFISLPEQALQYLLKQGWVALNQKNYNKNSCESFKKLSSLQNSSIKLNKGIYLRKSQILSFIYQKSNFVGIVTNVIQGFIYEITELKTQQIKKVQLSMVICPIGDEVGSYMCRQFARKQLIGKQVNVYLHKEEGLNTTGSIVRIDDWKDIQSVLVQNGYGLVRQQVNNRVLSEKYNVLQNKSKQKKLGLHQKDIGNKRFQDLTQPLSKKQYAKFYIQRRMDILSRLLDTEQIVIQQIINPLSYKIRVESSRLLLKFRLEGIVQPKLNPNLKQHDQIKLQTDNFLKRHFNQRTMTASIIDYDDQTNQFIGTLYTGNQKQKIEVQQILIKNCLVYADKQNFISKFHDLQKEAKKTQKIIWQSQLKCFEPGFDLTKDKNSFNGKFSWIHNGRIAYVQQKNKIELIEKMENKIRSAKLVFLPKQKIHIGAWCAAPYEGDLYRAIIKSKKDQQVTVQFIDWGNQQIVKVQTLRELPQQYLYVEKQCIKINLNLLAPIDNKPALQRLRKDLFEVYLFKRVQGNTFDFFTDKKGSVNERLIYKNKLKPNSEELKRYQSRNIKSK